jgi:hypothetical protein
MKMVKSLLLGSAAGLVAVTVGQAADLPVKAKPVEYVKICSLYGAGFYYMPGTDMCIKIGGWMRVEVGDATNGSFTSAPWQAVNTRATNNLDFRARGYITADAREQTAYGTARAYIDVGISTNDVGTNGQSNTFSSNRAFLQWAGMTAGLTQSFYDFYSVPAVSYRGYIPASDTGDPGWWVWGYTAQLGNGVSATISAEERRTTQILGINAAAATPLVGSFSNIVTAPAPGYGGFQAPDIVGNLRVDQTWGSAQIMAAAHELNPLYYSGAAGATVNGAPNGHASDQWGFVVGAGLRLNFPMVAQGDYFQGQVNYTQGALKYVNQSANGVTLDFERGNTAAFGLVSDCVYGVGATTATGTGCQQTTAWGFNAAYEHYWTPQFHESFVGGYEAVSYDSSANNMLCDLEATGASLGTGATAVAGCSNNFSVWGASTRFQYDVTKTFYLGVEALYQVYDSASQPGGVLTAPGAVLLGNAAQGGLQAGSTVKDENNVTVTLRMHKDFLP